MAQPESSDSPSKKREKEKNDKLREIEQKQAKAAATLDILSQYKHCTLMLYDKVTKMFSEFISSQRTTIDLFEKQGENALGIIESTIDEKKKSGQINAIQADFMTQISRFSYSLWNSAGQPYRNVLDVWAEAQKKTRETIEAYFDVLGTIPKPKAPPPAYPNPLDNLTDLHSPLMYVEHVRALAFLMWEASDRQRGETVDDFVEAAQKHLSTVTRAAISTVLSAADAGRAVAQALERFSPSLYLDEIRRVADTLAQDKGETSGPKLDDWLEAEKRVLNEIAAGKPVPGTAPDP